LEKPVTLKQLQAHGGGGGALQDLQVLRTTRLSVTKVSEAEWNFITNELIQDRTETE
jgi:predicted RNA-binding protein with PUA-like domain